jgi:hypothetical protein
VARWARANADRQADRLAGQPSGDAIVTVTVASPLTVNWRGGTYVVKRLASYSPTVGDRVQLRVIDGQPIVQGKIV